MTDHPEIGKLEYSKITKYIYIGTNQCCQTHFDEKLKKEGITTDISLEKEKIDIPFGAEFYIWIPVKDHSAPSQDQFDFGVAVLEKLVSLKRKVYVHCKNGHGRAPTLIAAYFIKQSKTPNEAIEFIKTKRSSIHLQDIQKEALIEFAKRTHKSLCCVGPLVLIMFGLGTASTALSIGSKKLYFLVFGLIFFAVSLFIFIRYRRKNICEGCSTKEQERKRIINTVLVAFTTFIVLYALLVYVVVPGLSPIIYEKKGAVKSISNINNQPDLDSFSEFRKVSLKIEGMTCTGCAIGIENALKNLPGVSEAKIEYPQGMGSITYDPQQITLEKIIESIKPYEVIVAQDSNWEK